MRQCTWQTMVDRWLTATLVVAAIGLAACGGDNGGEADRSRLAAVEEDTP